MEELGLGVEEQDFFQVTIQHQPSVPCPETVRLVRYVKNIDNMENQKVDIVMFSYFHPVYWC